MNPEGGDLFPAAREKDTPAWCLAFAESSSERGSASIIVDSAMRIAIHLSVAVNLYALLIYAIHPIRCLHFSKILGNKPFRLASYQMRRPPTGVGEARALHRDPPRKDGLPVKKLLALLVAAGFLFGTIGCSDTAKDKGKDKEKAGGKAPPKDGVGSKDKAPPMPEKDKDKAHMPEKDKDKGAPPPPPPDKDKDKAAPEKDKDKAPAKDKDKAAAKDKDKDK
jgi:hypothetical protein